MKKELTEILQKHVPAEAVDYCVQLWENKHFSFTVSRTRSSCYGNHSFRSDKGHHITVNHDLNPHAFLLTYVHEVAHLKTFEDNQRTFLQKMLKRRPKIDPHGEEWKRSFQVLMQPILNERFFPESILQPLQLYMQNPKASSVSYHPLAKVLHLNEKEGDFLSDLAIGQLFVFRDKTYKKIETRRTRILCEEQATKKRFLIASIAKVEPTSTILEKIEISKNTSLKLSNIADGQRFMFKNEIFIKKEKRRTRVLCEEVKSKKMFTIPAEAPVILVD